MHNDWNAFKMCDSFVFGKYWLMPRWRRSSIDWWHRFEQIHRILVSGAYSKATILPPSQIHVHVRHVRTTPSSWFKSNKLHLRACTMLFIVLVLDFTSMCALNFLFPTCIYMYLCSDDLWRSIWATLSCMDKPILLCCIMSSFACQTHTSPLALATFERNTTCGTAECRYPSHCNHELLIYTVHAYECN